MKKVERYNKQLSVYELVVIADGKLVTITHTPKKDTLTVKSYRFTAIIYTPKGESLVGGHIYISNSDSIFPKAGDYLEFETKLTDLQEGYNTRWKIVDFWCEDDVSMIKSNTHNLFVNNEVMIFYNAVDHETIFILIFNPKTKCVKGSRFKYFDLKNADNLEELKSNKGLWHHGTYLINNNQIKFILEYRNDIELSRALNFVKNDNLFPRLPIHDEGYLYNKLIQLQEIPTTVYKGEIINNDEIIFEIGEAVGPAKIRDYFSHWYMSDIKSVNVKNEYYVRFNSIKLFPSSQEQLYLNSEYYPVILIPNKIKKYIINSSKESNLSKLVDYFNILSPEILALRNLKNIKRGKTELMFLSHLLNKFGNQIRVDVSPNSSISSYYPDVVLVCNITGLHIDIEIDEPYSLSDKAPIHYVGSDDDSRNEYFLGINWCIIRFSENQIVEQTDLCISLIESILFSIQAKHIHFKYDLKTEPKWTYEQALVMSYNNTRYNYSI